MPELWQFVESNAIAWHSSAWIAIGLVTEGLSQPRSSLQNTVRPIYIPKAAILRSVFGLQDFAVGFWASGFRMLRVKILVVRMVLALGLLLLWRLIVVGMPDTAHEHIQKKKEDPIKHTNTRIYSLDPIKHTKTGARDGP